MRYVLMLLLIVGCPGRPQQARGDDAGARYEAAVAKLSAESKERDDAMAVKVDGMAATLGNSTSELECVKGELKSLRDEFAKLYKAITTDATINIRVPDPICEPQPTRADAVPIENADQRVTLHGKPLDVAAVIKANYRVRWTHPGNIDSHLAEHGVAGVSGLDNETKEKLHSALHEMGESPSKPVKSVVKQKAIVSLPMASGGCPNGHCPNAQQSWTYFSRSRRR